MSSTEGLEKIGVLEGGSGDNRAKPGEFGKLNDCVTDFSLNTSLERRIAG